MEQNRKQHVVVTGAAGFVGNQLVRALLGEGHKVSAVIHQRPLEGLDDSGRLQVIKEDITKSSVQKKLLQGADVVCHLAAFIPPNYESPAYAEDCFKINGLLTMQLAQEAFVRKIRFINFSTAAVYHYSDSPVDEDARVYPYQKAVYYAGSKLFGELTVEHLRQQGFGAITFRIGSCYGAGMPEKSVVSYFMKSVAQGLELNVTNGGIARYDYVHVTDVVKIALAAIAGGDPGIYNVGTGRSYSVTELAESILCTYPDKNVAINSKPLVDGRLKGLPALVIDKAKRMWGYSPLSLQEGLSLYRKDLENQKSNSEIL